MFDRLMLAGARLRMSVTAFIVLIATLYTNEQPVKDCIIAGAVWIGILWGVTKLFGWIARAFVEPLPPHPSRRSGD